MLGMINKERYHQQSGHTNYMLVKLTMIFNQM